MFDAKDFLMLDMEGLFLHSIRYTLDNLPSPVL